MAIATELKIPATLATEENWSTEYGILEMNVAVVDSVAARIAVAAAFVELVADFAQVIEPVAELGQQYVHFAG